MLEKLHALPGIVPASTMTAAGFNPAGILAFCYLIACLTIVGVEHPLA
jgi:hypothetical protein